MFNGFFSGSTFSFIKHKYIFVKKICTYMDAFNLSFVFTLESTMPILEKAILVVVFLFFFFLFVATECRNYKISGGAGCFPYY